MKHRRQNRVFKKMLASVLALVMTFSLALPTVAAEVSGSDAGSEDLGIAAASVSDSELANVALGKTVTETTTTPSNGQASAIVNGLIMEESGAAIGWPTTYWNGGEAPASFTIDLGAFYEINKFVAYPFWDKGGSDRYYNYKICTSVDGVNFTEQFSKTDTTAETPEGTEYALSETVKARYVKVEMTGSNIGRENGSLGACHMVEFEVYGRETAVRVEPEMSLSETDISLPLNSTKQLSVTATDEWGEAITEGISWASSDSEVAEVDENGLVTPKASGDVVITASYAEYELSVTCSIHVYDSFTESVNLALGKDITNGLGAGEEANAGIIVDGNIAAYGWPVDYWYGKSPASFTIDLGKLYAIDKFVAYPYWDKGGSERYYNYTIYTSVDGIFFNEACSKTDTTPETIDGTEFALTEAVKAQYVKVEMTKSNQGTQYTANGWAHMAEFEVYGQEVPEFTNVALGKTVTETTTTPSNGQASAIVNGLIMEESGAAIGWPTTYWNGGNAPASFTIDLGKFYEINEFVAYPFWDKDGSDRYYNYVIYTSLDGTTFTEAASKIDTTAETPEGTSYALEELIKARYVKVEMTASNRGDSSGSWVHMVEFEVYGRECEQKPELNLTKSTLKLPVSVTDQLTAYGTDLWGQEITEGITWESSDPEIAEVDENGLVTSKAAGDAVITAYYEACGLSASCNVHVFDSEGGEYKEVLQNVALNKPVSSNVPTSAGQNPVLITDGNINNYWDGGVYPAFFIIDLGEVYEIEKFIAYPYFSLDGTRYYQYKIETSVNGTTYDFAAEKMDTVPQTKDGDAYLFEQPRAVRYIKVTMTYCSSTKWVHMNEFEAYAKQYVEPVEAEISVNKFALRMPVDGETTLTAEGTDMWGDTVSDIIFTSGDESIAVIDENGLVTALTPGKTAITVSSAACDKSVTVEVEVYDPEAEEDEIKIVAYWAPMSDFTNDEQYDYISEANFNWVMSMQNNLGDVMRCVELCAARGMEYIGIDCDLVYQTNKLSETVVKQAVDRYKYLPGFGGFYHKDEPHPGTELDYVGVIQQIKSEWPETYVHMNFLASPSYNLCYSQTGLSFRDMLDSYAEALGSELDYLMFDLYPFGKEEGSFNATWYSDMNTVREVGLEHDAKTATYIQSIGHVGYRRPTGTEIGYEVAVALAYGCKQIAYYTYFEPYSNAMGSEQGSAYTSAIIDKNGNKTDLYEPVKEINRQVMTLSPTLINLDAVEVYHAGQLDGQAGVPEDFFAQAAEGNKVILSHMQDEETGKNYLMVVNKDFTNAQDITITLDSDILLVEEISKEDGNAYVVEKNDGSITLTFTAGEGKLFELNYSSDLAKEDAEEVDEIIEALGTITLDSEEAVEAARKAYENLNEDAKAYVTKLDVLEAAEKKLEELKNQESTGDNTDSSDKDDESDQESADGSTDSSDKDDESDQESAGGSTDSSDKDDENNQESADGSTDSSDKDNESDQDNDSSQESADSNTDNSDRNDDSDQGTADDDAESNDQGNQSEQAASPSTGDNSGLGGYLALLAAAAAGIIALILERKRRAGKF